ncbi:MAG: IPT/TIG domain-containing protein [Candidatus Acidiferrum sp.]
MEYPWAQKVWFKRFSVLILLLLAASVLASNARANTNRSTYIPYDYSWVWAPDFKLIAFDQIHQQIFVAWTALDRIDVLSSSDYHTIQTIVVPSPSSLDLSPDGTTLAVATSSAHIQFFDSGTFVKTSDIVFPDSALGITAFVFAGNGNAFVRAGEGLSTGGGITAYWNHVTNSFSNESNAEGATGPYQTTGPLARSGDYSRIMLGDATSGGSVQIIDGNTGAILQQLAYGGYILGLAANKDASRYAVCAEPAGLADFLIILDSNFNEIYQDAAGCIGIAFSADGNTLYRDVGGDTQGIDMTTFSTKDTTNYFSQQSSGYSTQWQVADGTGMVYGLNPNTPNDVIFVVVDTTAASTPAIPPISDPVHILRVIDNIGSPQGGDMIRILCTGADSVGQSSVSVTIGGAAATGVTVTQVGAFPTLPNLRWVTVKTPPGTSGRVDVTLTAAGKSDTVSDGFQYARSVKLFPFSSSPNFLLYDSGRQKLYAAHKDQVEVVDPIAQQVLTPIVPASGKLANSQFAGLSLSPDGNRLYVADAGANLIHEIDLAHPGAGTSLDPTKAVGSSMTLTPGRIFETSTGALVGSDVGGNLFTIDPTSGTGSWLKDSTGSQLGGHTWNTTNKGSRVFISRDGDGLIWSTIGLWDASTSTFLSSMNETEWIVEASANEDGTVIAAGGSTPGIADSNAEIADFNLNTVGFIMQHFDSAMPTGTPSFFLHPSGALLYKAGSSAVGGSVEIDDVNQWQSTANITFPEPFVTSYSPFTDHMLTTDNTGRYLFGVTNSGITMMVLDTVPLSIGNVQPPFGQPAGGQTVTIRGSGFESGAVVSLGGVQSATTFVDENTLTVVVPALPSGWQDVAAANSNGDSYTARGIFQILATQPTPLITGFSPASAILSLSEEPLPITIIGSGFDDYDTVEINGELVDSAFIDSNHIQATIPYQLTGQTGSVPFTVASPYTGSSNILSIPLVNPVPAIDSLFPATLATGSSVARFDVYGKNFVAGSIAQWNGQNLATSVAGGVISNGEELLIASVPGNLLTSSGTAAINVVNPAPGGGTSNASSLDISPAHPVVSYPTTIDFGSVLLNTPSTQTIQLANAGSANYTVTSIAVGSTLFSVQPYICNNIGFTPGSNYCIFQLNFSATTVGLASTTLTIADNTAGSPHTIPVTATGTQTLVPAVTLLSIDALGQPVSATVNGTATFGGPNVPAVAWVEYGTDPTLSAFSKSAQWSFTGDGAPLSGSITGLTPATTYAARLVVQTSGGTGKSNIGRFATIAAWPEVNLTLATGTSNVATITAGQTATYQLLVWDGGNGYTGTASISCSGAPTGSACVVTPANIAFGLNGAPVSVTVTTTRSSSAALRRRGKNLVLAAGLWIAIAIAGSKKRLRSSLLICLTALAFSACSCGGGSSGSSSGPPPPPSTPAGTYYLTVSASAGGAQTSYLLTLNVN